MELELIRTYFPKGTNGTLRSFGGLRTGATHNDKPSFGMVRSFDMVRQAHHDINIDGRPTFVILRQAQDDKERTVICFTIELPWRNNEQRVSCIPEGRYELTRRYSPRFGWHLLVNNVVKREFILIHAFNDALKESKGCIAPVSVCTGEGKGNNSRLSLKKLLAVTSLAFDKKEKVFLTIQSKS
jgi:hypothetical protein